MMIEPRLVINNLNVKFTNLKNKYHALHNISLHIGREIVGIVGESGSGKSLTAKAILGLLPSNATCIATQFSFMNHNLLDSNIVNNLRGKSICMIPQDPYHSFNPVLSVGFQISEMYRIHYNMSPNEAKAYSIEQMQLAQLPNPLEIYKKYPFELSGGMAQRAMIAMMTTTKPLLLIADEPTSALDKVIEENIFSLLLQFYYNNNATLLIISHDLSIISKYCQRIVFMYRGHIVEVLPNNDLSQAKHPYSRSLIACQLNIENNLDVLSTIDKTYDYSIK